MATTVADGAPAATEEHPRHMLDRPRWTFDVLVAMTLAIGAFLMFNPSRGMGADFALLAAIGMLLALGCAWLACLISCTRHRRLGKGWRAALGWMVAPLMVASVAGIDRAVGGVDHVAFQLSSDAMTRDAQVRLAQEPSDDVHAAAGIRIGWLDIDFVDAATSADPTEDCAVPFVSYEVYQGMMVGYGYIYSPTGPPCAEDVEHVEGPWYWARLWD